MNDRLSNLTQLTATPRTDRGLWLNLLLKLPFLLLSFKFIRCFWVHVRVLGLNFICILQHVFLLSINVNPWRLLMRNRCPHDHIICQLEVVFISIFAWGWFIWTFPDRGLFLTLIWDHQVEPSSDLIKRFLDSTHNQKVPRSWCFLTL